MIEHAKQLLHSVDGSALVEFALLLPIMILVFIGVVDYALMIQQAMQVSEAATAGAAYGAMPGNQKDFTGMQAAAMNAATGVSSLTVTAADFFTCTPGGAAVSSSTTCSGYGTPIEYIQVQTSAAVPPLMAYTGISTLTLKGNVSFRVQWTP